jgi:VWFA-related protein
VLARDGAGRPVTDLARSDITVLEDGAAQQIVAFERVSLPIVSPAAAATAPALRRDVSTNEAVGAARVFILVLDSLHIAPSRNLDVRRFARRFVEQHVGAGDLAAVISPGAAPEATEDFTSDKARLVAAIDRFTGSKLTSATVEREREARQFYDGVPLHGGKDPSDGERANRAYSLTGTLEALARHVDRVEGRRKALLLFSEGIDYDTSDVMGERQRYTSEVNHAMQRAVGALMRTNVAMYAVDPRVLGSVQGDLIETPIYERRPGDPAGFSERAVADEHTASIRSLRDLAHATGGFLASDLGVDRAFGRIVDESSDYYVVGYTPARPPKPGESRKIAVRISRPGVTSVARRGYVVPEPAARPVAAPAAADPIGPPMGMPGRPRGNVLATQPIPGATPVVAGLQSELAALLASPLPKAGLPLRVQAIPFKGNGNKRSVHVVIEILGRDLRFADRGGRAEERIELALMTVDDRGRGANGNSTTIDLRLSAAELQRVRTTGVRWLSKLDLAPARYQLRVAARAVGSGLSGLVTHRFDAPRLDRDRLAMSGVTLTSLPSALMLTSGKAWLEKSLALPPSAARQFVAGDQITAAVEIYVPASSRTDVPVTAEVDGPGRPGMLRLQEKTGSGAQLPTREAAFALDTKTLAPGEYVMRIRAGAEGSDARVEREVVFEIVK